MNQSEDTYWRGRCRYDRSYPQSTLPFPACSEHCLKAWAKPPSRPPSWSLSLCLQGRVTCPGCLHPTLCPRILKKSSNLDLRPEPGHVLGTLVKTVLTAPSPPQRKALTRQVSAGPASPWRFLRHHLRPVVPLTHPNPMRTPSGCTQVQGARQVSSPGGEKGQHLRVKLRAGGSPWMCP